MNESSNPLSTRREFIKTTSKFASVSAVAGAALELAGCATKEPSEGNDKVIWILVIVLVHFIGALIYFFARRPQRIARYGS